MKKGIESEGLGIVLDAIITVLLPIAVYGIYWLITSGWWK